MRSERKVTRIRGNYAAPQKVTKKKRKKKEEATYKLGLLVGLLSNVSELLLQGGLLLVQLI